MRPLRVPPGAPLTAVLHVTKGLVDVAEAELAELVPAATITERTDRFLLARLTADDLAGFGARTRTVDDLRLLVAGPAPVATQEELRRLAADAAVAVVDAIEEPGDEWSVTLATRNPPWKRKPRWDPAPVLAAELRAADPTATQRRPVDLRLQVEDAQAHLALNLWDRPVGKSDDDVPPYRGALRPTVAAAMVRLAVTACSPAARAAGVYDPFGGSGTIVAEAVRAGLGVFASDVSEEALTITRTRLAALGVPDAEPVQRVFARDVRRGPDQRVTAHMVVTNLPWGAQVPIERRLELFDAVGILVANRVMAGGAAVLLTTHEDALVARLRRHGLRVTARRVGLLGQTPGLVIARPPG